MPAYVPKNFNITASQLNKGSLTNVASAKLSIWPRTIATGLVKNTAGTLMSNAGLLLYSKISVNAASKHYLGMAFTDINARYAVSLPMLATGHVYYVDVIAPAKS